MPTENTDTKDTHNTAEAQNNSTEENTPAEAQNSSASESEQPESTLPKTQEELDKLIERQVKKERKKWEKEQSKPETEDKPAETADNSAELERLRSELQESRAQNNAAKLGFKADVIDDAVYLAVRNAAKNNDGDFDDEDIKTELSAVLKKHPEWKANAGKGTGFRVGAPEPKQSVDKTKTTAQKSWNRFNH